MSLFPPPRHNMLLQAPLHIHSLPARIYVSPTGRITLKFEVGDFYENLSMNSKFV